jgi:hypothetical protein
MAATNTIGQPQESASRSTAAAARRSAEAAAEPDVATETIVAEGGSDVMQAVSRMVYSGAYALAYGVVYATVFVAQSLPQENPVMHGFRDGGRAAMDELSGISPGVAGLDPTAVRTK